jgi:predicted FMN-binding regulatory protein PaiB
MKPSIFFGDREILVIVQGHHGYISPSWYAVGETRAPTWNFTAEVDAQAPRTCAVSSRSKDRGAVPARVRPNHGDHSAQRHRVHKREDS